MADCGYRLSAEYLLDRYPDLVEIRRNTEMVMLDATDPATQRIARDTGVELRREGFRVFWHCPLCGELTRATCDPAKHAAFYEELEAVQRRGG